MSQKCYKGLPNIGATCYINSFLQTLFMTPEFRDGIYGWTYNQKKHPKREDSILFQLQKLFAKLQMGYNNISTRQLVKSFQWQEDEVMNQQDIQQFNRILFEALQKSFYNQKSKSIIKELYQGQLAQYTKCMQCYNQSIRQEMFQDLILMIKNIYQKVYNPSIQHSLQRYIKPQLLDQHNLYQCNICNKLVRAERGVKFIKLPKFLNLVLQRFNFDYETMTKNKINDKCTFPFILNFNNYFNGYNQIPNKLNQDSSQYFLQQEKPKKTTFKPNLSKNITKNTQPSVAGKIKTKPSANTKSFLQQMRKKKLNMAQSEDLIYVNGTTSIQPKVQTQTINSNKNIQQNKQKRQEVISGKQSTKQKKQGQKNVEMLPQIPKIELLHMDVPKLTEVNPRIILNENKLRTKQQQLQQILKQKQKLNKQIQINLLQNQVKNNQLIKLYLKDGPLVYQLYSILIHSGSSNAGHYYSYIKSFQNDNWYHFNDQRVSVVNVVEIQKSFGGLGIANAYVLYYRLVSQQKYKIQSQIPPYIKKIVNQQQQLLKLKVKQRQIDLQNILILKIYFQLGVKTIQILKQSHFKLFFQKAKQMFNILQPTSQNNHINNHSSTFIKKQNIRLRLFNPSNDMKLDTYTGQQENSLFQLNIRSYQNFVLQVKGDSQQFQQFIPGFMTIRIALWQQNTNIKSLEDINLIIHKISIRKISNMLQVQNIIQSKRKQCLKQSYKQQDVICIIKRHQNDEYLYHQIINLQNYYDKTADSIGIFQNQILFVELDNQNLNWPRQFQNQINRITVKITGSLGIEPFLMTVDSRMILNQLKKQICTKITHPIQETIVRRGNRSGLQLKNCEVSLKDNRFINGTTLFLQKGLPAKQGEIRIQLFLAYDAAIQVYNRLHQFQFVADVPIDTNLKAHDVKEIFKKILKKQKNIDLQCEKIRIRQKVNDKIGKIYRQKPMKQQQIIQKRQIAIQFKEDKTDNKDYLIYIRIWNQFTWTLSEKQQFYINKSTTVRQLSHAIYQKFKQIDQNSIFQPEQMDICRILSIHKFKIIDLVDMEYFSMNSQLSVFGQPMFVNSDGLLYIIKQTTIQPRQLTKQQQQIFGGKIKTVIRPTKGRSNLPVHNQKKQKGISIKVIQKIQQQEQKQK